ncbi:MAG: Gfo/Idh/MocA family oxidoreductase [Aureliella sp.]
MNRSRIEQLAALPYKPISPRSYKPNIGLIGCGGITSHHLAAYKAAGFHVTALCDIDRAKAKKRADEYFPEAQIFESYTDLLADDSIEVVDIATHPAGREVMIEAALHRRKHVLSQKPFVLDLNVGRRLADLADARQCYLAVNQNGRWAPHFSCGRVAIEAGLLGRVFSVHMGCHWDHTWVEGTEFEKVKHLVLYDYAIHWFDMVRCYLGGAKAKQVFASTARVPGQKLMPALLGQALIEFEDAQSTLSFDAAVKHGQLEETFVAGTEGSFHSTGTGNQEQTAYITVEGGMWRPKLEGKWFPDGFHGTMGELLCAIEDNRTCRISADDNLHSLALCFAAIESAETGSPVKPGSVTRLPT